MIVRIREDIKSYLHGSRRTVAVWNNVRHFTHLLPEANSNSKSETRTSWRCGRGVVQESEAIITPKTQKLGETSNRFDKKRFVWSPQRGDKPAVISRRHLKARKMYPGGAKEVISWSWDSKGGNEGLSVLFASWMKILNWSRVLQNANTLNLWQEVSKGSETSLVFNILIF